MNKPFGLFCRRISDEDVSFQNLTLGWKNWYYWPFISSYYSL